MTQEVQTTLNYQAELNRTEWIGYQERRISDKMQVRDKFSNSRDGNTPNLNIWYADRVTPSSRTVNNVEWGVTYKVEWGEVIVPLAWAYLVEITPSLVGTQTSYYYTIQVRVNGKSKFSIRINYAYHSVIPVVLNLGRRDRVTLAAKADSVTTTDTLGLRLIKL